MPSEKEPKCIGCEFGSYLITFDDGSHLMKYGKPAIFCVAPENWPGLDDPTDYPCFSPKKMPSEERRKCDGCRYELMEEPDPCQDCFDTTTEGENGVRTHWQPRE